MLSSTGSGVYELTNQSRLCIREQGVQGVFLSQLFFALDSSQAPIGAYVTIWEMLGGERLENCIFLL